MELVEIQNICTLAYSPGTSLCPSLSHTDEDMPGNWPRTLVQRTHGPQGNGESVTASSQPLQRRALQVLRELWRHTWLRLGALTGEQGSVTGNPDSPVKNVFGPALFITSEPEVH